MKDSRLSRRSAAMTLIVGITCHGVLAAQAPRLLAGLANDLSACHREARTAAEAAAPDAAALLACVDRIRAADLIVGEEHKDLQTHLRTDGASADALARHARVVEASRVEFDAVYALADAVARARDAGDQAALRSAADALARHLASRLSPADRRPLAQSVAYSRLNLARVPAPTGPAVVPAYLQTEVVPPTSDDLAAESDTKARAQIAAQAGSLGRDPIAIFEFVQNEIETEFYQGVVKGAAETLRQKRGNGSDQAALLVALMRASDVPARFVRGTIMLDAAQAIAWTGVSSARRAADIFTRAGIPFDAITQGGGIGAFRIEHIWVEVFVSYGNYRGVPLDAAGRAWVPLDPSWKPLTFSRGKPVPADARFTAEAVTTDYLSAPQQKTIADFYKTRIAEALTAQDASARFEDVVGTFARQSIRSGLLPNTLPYAVALVTDEQTTLPSALQHQLRFVASGDGGPSFDVTLPASAVVGQRMTLSYVPATVEDQITANAFLGMDNTPAYLLRLRPVLKVGGIVRAAGETTVQMGALHDVRVEIQSPGRTTAVANSMVAGGYYAIAFGLQEIAYVPPDPPLPADTEHGAADLLFQRAADYLDRWSAIERLLGGILGVVPVHPILSMAIVGNEYRRTVLFGQPQSLEWRGVFIDADLRVTEPVPIDGADTLRSEFMRLSGLAGSALESEILHDAFEVDAVSATRLIQLARLAGTQIEHVTRANVDAVLPTLGTADEVKAHVRDAVNQGLEVTIPAADAARNIWSGIGYIALNPTSGEGGYFISGGLAGGMTTTDPDAWVRQQYVDDLGNPYHPTPNTDPNAAFSITRLVITDKQDGKVDEWLQRDLAVWVRDAEGRPVEGANVTFKVLLGDGKFSAGAGGGASSEVVEQTNNLGIAKANVKLGKKTGDSPFYVKRQGDQFATQIGNNAITAKVAAAGGDIPLDVPFQLFAYPGLPHHINKVVGDHNVAFTGTAGGTLLARLVDEFENPIANQLLTFEVLPPVPDQSATPTFRNMTIYPNDPPCANAHPLLGDCNGVSLLTRKASVHGASVETILGNAQSARYRVSVAAHDIPAQTFEVFSFDKRGDSFLPRLNMSLLQLINDRGQPLNSTKVGTVFQRPLRTELFVTEQDYEWERLPPVDWPPINWPIDEPLPPHPPNFAVNGLGTVRTRAIDTGKSGPIEYPQFSGVATGDKSQESATVDFTVRAGAGSALPAINPGHGIYSSRLTVGPQPGVNTVEVGAAARVVAPKFDGLQGFVEIEVVDLKPGQRLDGFRDDGSAIISGQPYTMTHEVTGVRATLEPRNLLVGQSGGTVKDFTLDYLIEPPNYNAQVAYVDLLKQPPAGSASAQDEWLGFLPGSATEGEGTATVYQGTGFDPARRYRMQVVLNRGSEAEIKSDAIELGAYLLGPFGSDFRSRRFTALEARKLKERDLADALRTERSTIQDVLRQGLVNVATTCGVSVPAAGLLILEQGTGACFWRATFAANPVGACAAFHPGISDHDYEVFIPNAIKPKTACIIDELTKAADVEDLGEVTFFDVPKEELLAAKLNLLPPPPTGADPTGDLGLGRQTLLLGKILLEGEYVKDVAGVNNPAPDLEALVTKLREDPAVRMQGEQTGIPRLEGYEQALLQKFAFYKSRAHVRMHGADITPKSYVYELAQRELRNAGKAAIRAAAGRLAADVEGNKLMFLSRADYLAGGCVTGTEDPAQPRPILLLFPKPCDTFEEHVASTAVKSYRQGLNIFTEPQVQQIYQFYRIKADPPCAATNCRTQISDEADGNRFVAGALVFIEEMAAATQAVYLDTLVNEEPARRAQRGANATDAIAKAITVSSPVARVVEARVFNGNDMLVPDVSLNLYSDVAPTIPHTVTVKPLSEQIVDKKRETNGKLKPIFKPELPASGQHNVTIFLDPEDKVRECNKRDNYAGFFTYLLPPDPSLHPLEERPLTPVPFPNPPPECAENPLPQLTITKLVNGQPHIKVAPFTRVKLTHVLRNTGPVPLSGVTLTDLLTKRTFGPFTIPVGQKQDVQEEYVTAAAGKELIAPSEAIGFSDGHGFATAWDSVYINVVTPPCDVMITSYSTDPNPTSPDGKPVSEVMQGGSLFRYYKVVDGTGAPRGPVGLALKINGRFFGATTNAAGEIIHPSFSADDNPRGLRLLADAIGGVGTYRADFVLVAGTTSVCGQPFDVEIKEREFSRAWNAGASIEAEATALVGLGGKAGHGIGISADDRAHATRTKLSIDRSVNGELAVVAKSPEDGGRTLPFSQMLFDVKIRGSLGVVSMASDTHEFTIDSSGELDAAQRAAFGGLIAATVASASIESPVVVKLLESLIDRYTNFEAYHEAAGWSVGEVASGSFSIGPTGITPIGKANPNEMQYGVGLTGSVNASASAVVGIDYKRKAQELVPGYSLSAAGSISGALGVHAGGADEELKEKLTAALKGTLAGGWKAKLTLDERKGFKPVKLTIGYSSVKGFGFKLAGKSYVDVGNGFDPDKKTQTFVITDEHVIQEAIDSLETIATLAASSAAILPAPLNSPVVLGPPVLVAEMIKLFDILGRNDAEYENSTETGDGVELSLDIPLSAGASLKLSAGLAFDRSIGYSTEKGVIKKGDPFPLQRYGSDAYIPALPPNGTELRDLLDLGATALADTGASAIDVVSKAAQSGLNYIRSLHTAELAFDGASLGAPQISLASFSFKPVFGPVVAGPQRPADVSGRPDLPHYGIGGFHHFTPEAQTLTAPATLTFFYRDDEVVGLNEASLGIYIWNTNAQDWEFVGGTVDPVANTITTTVTRLGDYTAAPAMPGGSFSFTAQSLSGPVTYTSSVIRMNNGVVVPDGTVFTVETLAPQATSRVQFGQIVTADEDSQLEGVQVTSHSGVITFSVAYPGNFGAARVLAFSTPGTAIADAVVPF